MARSLKRKCISHGHNCVFEGQEPTFLRCVYAAVIAILSISADSMGTPAARSHAWTCKVAGQFFFRFR